MKKTLSILFSILTLTLMAQVPQGVGYQGVATDANGIELVNQSISIRASVLSGSATGTIEWEETHATSTDTFGLFTITIGQGTNTTNGLQTSFADISWGTNTYFLKIEMDVNGGTNYAFMGTNQMMSVPYALYAESANINYDSISNFLSGDSTFITNVSSGMGGGGCNYYFPDGFNGEAITTNFSTSNQFTVPTGKRLYILSTPVGMKINGVTVSAPQNGTFAICNAGDIVEPSTQTTSYYFNGYLADENYFAGCGGGGSSSVSSLDSTAIANMIAAAGGGCNFNYPDGLNGTPVIHDFIANGPYTVPAGKNFYTNMIFNNNSDDVLINSIKFHDSGTMNSSLNTILSEGDVISMTYNGGNTPPHKNMFGLLVDKKVQSLSYDFIANGPYTVPSGKKLYIYRIYHGGQGGTSYPHGVQINSLFLANYNQFTNGYNDVTFERHLVLKAGDVIDITDNGSPNFENMFGYLADENYFAGCGGGGGGSSSSSLDSTAIANMIAAAGGSGCSFKYPEGLNGDAITHELSNGNSYTVPAGKKLYILNHYSINDRLIIDNITISLGSNEYSSHSLANPVIASPGQIITTAAANASSFNGLLVNDITDVQAITHELQNGNSYTVPAGKKLYILNHYSINDRLIIDNITISLGSNEYSSHSLANPIIASSGQVITTAAANASAFNGYLVDENYFAGCGGGGSSSTSTTNNQINNYNNILNLSATSGDFNYLYASYPTNSSFNYTVPAGKIMKITDHHFTNVGNSNDTYINGQLWTMGADIPTLLSEGTQIEIQFDYAGDGISIQYELIDNIQGITLNYLYESYPNSSSFNYTVPTGKIMKITDHHFTNVGNSNDTYINGQLWTMGADIPTLLSEGTQVQIQLDYAGDSVSIQYILFDN